MKATIPVLDGLIKPVKVVKILQREVLKWKLINYRALYYQRHFRPAIDVVKIGW